MDVKRDGMKVAVQLYSVRRDMAAGMERTLAEIAEMGYRHVEFAGFFGRSAEQVRAVLDANGLRCVSAHLGMDELLADPRERLSFLRTIGADFAVIPGVDPARLRDPEELARLAAEISRIGSILREGGIRLLYHNHDFEFARIGGEYLLDMLYASVPPDLLQLELDTCWADHAGQDPAAYIARYAGRVPLIHLKDYASDGAAFEFRVLGTGRMDIPAVLQACTPAGTECLVVEHDEAQPGVTDMDMARRGREYLSGRFGRLIRD